jgi:hypothetical protein
MSTNISNAPLGINLKYYPDGANQATVSVSSLETPPLSPFGIVLQSQLTSAGIQPYLDSNLGDMFTSQWQSIKIAQEANAVQVFTAAAQTSGNSVTHVNAVFPLTGTLWADTVSPTPATPGMLTLSYQLQGCDIAFDTGSVTAEWDVSFDLTVVLSTPVPILPFSLGFSANVQAANANASADNFVAWCESTLSDLVSFLGSVANDLGISASSSDIPSSMQPPAEQQMQDGVNGINAPLNNTLGVGVLAASLNQSSSLIVGTYGFTECAFSIVPTTPGNGSLLLTLTHPLDPAPVLQNANSPLGKLVMPASLAASSTQFAPLSNLSVQGSNFPLDTHTQLSVEWANTSSGSPALSGGGEVEVTGPGGSGSGTFNVSQSAFNLYTYTTGPLTPGAYTFKARCQDLISYSRWSAPLTLNTSSSNVVNLVLRLVGNSGTGVVLGSSPLSASSTQWACSGQIPAGTANGSYDLIAQLTGGAVLATTTIVVTSTPQAILEFFDPGSNTVDLAPLISGGGSFTVRGENFPIGSVTVTITGGSAVQANTPAGEFQLTLTAPGSSGSSESIPVQVTASSNGVDKVVVSISFNTIGAPK